MGEESARPGPTTVVLYGNVSEGFTAVGPFPDFDTAAAWCEGRPLDGWVMTLTPPEELAHARRATRRDGPRGPKERWPGFGPFPRPTRKSDGGDQVHKPGNKPAGKLAIWPDLSSN